MNIILIFLYIFKHPHIQKKRYYTRKVATGIIESYGKDLSKISKHGTKRTLSEASILDMISNSKKSKVAIPLDQLTCKTAG
jgi:hypothetical protein